MNSVHAKMRKTCPTLHFRNEGVSVMRDTDLQVLTLKHDKSYAQSVTFAEEERSFLRHEGRHF